MGPCEHAQRNTVQTVRTFAGLIPYGYIINCFICFAQLALAGFYLQINKLLRSPAFLTETPGSNSCTTMRHPTFSHLRQTR